MDQNSQLRKSIRKQRRALSNDQQKRIEHDILKKFLTHPQFAQAEKIGFYLNAFGEVKTRKIIEMSFARYKKVYLPMICNMNQRLVWVKISKNQFRQRRFSRHALGMLEPVASRGLHVSHLDLLVLPLLACDPKGTRMGMGGGFYDRTLATAPQRPYRLGIAHDFQFLNEPLQRNDWDQPLDALITPSKVYRFSRHSSQFKL